MPWFIRALAVRSPSDRSMRIENSVDFPGADANDATDL